VQRRLILAVLIAIVPAWQGMTAAERFSVNSAQVAAAISNLGVVTKAEDVTLLTHVVAAVQSPSLRVRTVHRTYNDRLLVRMECAETDNCLPFFVSLRASEEASARLAAVTQSDSSLDRIGAQDFTRRPVAIHNGAPAILLIDGAHVHIRVPVVSLENGAIGQTIRVTEKDNHQNYMAVVVQDGLLQGRL
jgi:hypothetical protein